MQRTVFINSHYVTEKDAVISVFDRGFTFADAVYEVTAVVDGYLVEFDNHMARLQRSCQALSIPWHWSIHELKNVHQRLIEVNQLTEGGIYLQLTRGNAGDRDFYFPGSAISPSLIIFTQERPIIAHPRAATGIRCITLPDIRWQRCDIKTTGLLAACLAKETAHQQGKDDAIFIKDGFITEGSSSNVYIVTKDDRLITCPVSQDILHGITRATILDIAKKGAIPLEERTFSPEDAYSAREIFMTSATTFVLPIIELDNRQIDNGKPGVVTAYLRNQYINRIRQTFALNPILDTAEKSAIDHQSPTQLLT